MRKPLVVLILAFLINLIFVPSAVEAKPARTPWNGVTIEITSNLPASWNVKGALADIDWYTGSRFVLVKQCSGKNSCVQTRKNKISGLPVGYFHNRGCVTKYRGFSSTSTRHCSIYVDTVKAGKRGTYNAATKRWLVRHEIGHAAGGLSHSKKCVSTMYEYERCGRSVPPNTFTPNQIAVLRKH